jgi:hypothetical protein
VKPRRRRRPFILWGLNLCNLTSNL